MKRYFFCILLFVFAIFPSHAQEKRSFWSHGVGKLMKMGDDYVARMQEEGVDTNYIRKFDRDRIVYLGYYGYFQQHDMYFPVDVIASDIPLPRENMPSNMANCQYVAVDMHTYQSEMELGIDWRGIAIELPVPIRNKYSLSLGLAKNGSVWGARVRYKSINRMKGVLNDAYNQAMTQWRVNEMAGTNTPVTPIETTIHSGKLDLKIFYAEGYYVFNNKKFSLAAGLYGDMIQKRSAGSLFVMANYYQSRFGAWELFNSDRDTFRNWKVSIGPGYGYNWSLLGGSMCLHASFMPMVSLKNHLVHKNYNYIEYDRTGWESYDAHYYDAVDDGSSRFVFNCFGRVAASYSFDRFLVNMFINYRQYLYRNSADTGINNREVDGQINLGYRF